MVFEKEILTTKLRVAVSEVSDGDMNGNMGKNNLEEFLSHNTFSTEYCDMTQVHGITISKALKGRTDGDGVWTDENSFSLVVRTADCLPVVLLDPLKKRLIVLHCGYKGMSDGIVDRALNHMRKNMNNFSNIFVFLGPCICENCYVVDEPRFETFKKNFPESVFRIKNQFHLNIRDAVLRKLIANSIPASNVQQLERCTKEDQNLFSYRKGHKTERFVTVAEMRYV